MRSWGTRFGLMLGTFLGSAGVLASDLVVIVNAASPTERISREEVSDIFLGRYRQLPSGEPAVPIDNIQSMEMFYRKLIGRSAAEIGAYWAQLRFSGRAKPPEQQSQADALEKAARTAGAITYVDRSNVDKRVRVILELEH
jgi:ABC-type phosphate transport system substrate-binding protein